ncbi:flagellar M-ring protein FliF [Motilibacter peucedani]|uniref:Flagellar M-ring protein n=1 Tax=Motilibacter peucedani TaxID=598650 RepID=A0A420XTG8_9ACTN|nr:flagellar basal-body MS-ring/collar protein FliF [Motilibacter peucedani]RKS80135.1 flagellar M-ring protein FliF [Motilibacter peucedani]
MPKNLKRIADKPWQAFASFTPGQKAVTMVAVVVLLLGGVFFSKLTGGTAMEPLYVNLSAKDAAAVVTQLQSSGVAYQLQNGGTTILVPSDQVSALKLQMAGAGLIDDSTDNGYSVLTGMSVTSSQLQQDAALKQATEIDAASTLKAIAGVSDARVTIAVPKQDVFSDDTQKPTAAVLMTMKSGATLTSSQVNSITHLVAASVSGMSPEDVTVTDAATGRMLSSTSGSGAASADERSAQTLAYQDEMVQKLQTLLDPIVGPGAAVVRVNADLDYDNTKTTSNTYVAPTGTPLAISESSDVEKYAGDSQAVSGVMGPDNIGVNGATPAPGATPGATPGNGYTHEKSARDNALGTVQEVKVKAPGDVRKLSIAVVLDASAAKSVNTSEIQSLVTQAAGLDTKRGDAIQVSTMQFNTSAATQAAQAAKAQAALASKGQMMKYAKTGVLVLALLLTLLMTWLKSKKARTRMPVSRAELERLDELERRNAELEAEKAQLMLTGAPGQLAIGAAEPEDDNGEGLARVRTEIGEMVDSQPEEVAQLLRGWLADRRT